MASVSPAGLALIKRFEGLRLEAYRDPAGVWTIGYGHTGPDVTPGLKITQERAEELLRSDLRRFEQAVENALRTPARQPEFDAMVSLAYNIGVHAFKGSTVLARFNVGDRYGAAEAFGLWVKAKGMIFEGLVRRRFAEAVRFLRVAD